MFDNIKPTLDEVEWFEEGSRCSSPAWISDGRWYAAHSRQILVKSDYIFATFQEVFNWTAVNAGFPSSGWHAYPSFDDFKTEMKRNIGWWLMYSWRIFPDWLGVSLNSTRVEIEFDPSTSKVFLLISLRISNLPEYFQGYLAKSGVEEVGIGDQKRPQPPLAGLDLTAIYYGNVEALQLYEDYDENGSHYQLFFKAPARFLSQYKDGYTVALWVSPPYVRQSQSVNRNITVTMPPDKDILDVSPSAMAVHEGNVATFRIDAGDSYPESFRVLSGLPPRNFAQLLVDNVTRWAVEPTAWASVVTLIAISYTGLRGKRLLDRRRMYYRLYRSLVSLYDHYSQDSAKLSQEVESLSKTFTKYFIDDKITDDQFDKLLTRRDDLLERAGKMPKTA